MKYWCVNFDSDGVLKHGRNRNLWAMQYQFEYDDKNPLQGYKKPAIKNNWQQLKNVSEGDWLVAYLNGSRYFAVGQVIHPSKRRSADVETTIEEYLDRQMSHIHNNKIIFFTDAPALYEDFTDKWRNENDRFAKYAQRIDVESWQHIVPEGVKMPGLGEYILKKPYLAVTEIDRAFFNRIKKRLVSVSQSSIKANLQEMSSIPVEDDAAEAMEKSFARRQGFQLNSKLRKAIENHAMEAAKKHFRKLGYDVDDHSSHKPYDLHCRKKNSILYVEVKGTQSSGEDVFLTNGEVKFADSHSDCMVLFIHHSIVVSADEVVSGGVTNLVEPWDVSDGILKPLTYQYKVPS